MSLNAEQKEKVKLLINTFADDSSLVVSYPQLFGVGLRPGIFQQVLNDMLFSEIIYDQFCVLSIIIDLSFEHVTLLEYLQYMKGVHNKAELLSKIESTCHFPPNSCTQCNYSYIRLVKKDTFDKFAKHPITKKPISIENYVLTYGWGHKGSYTLPIDSSGYIKQTMLWVTDKEDFYHRKAEIVSSNASNLPSDLIRYLALPWYQNTNSINNPNDTVEVLMIEYSTEFDELLYHPNTTMGAFGYKFKGRFCSNKNTPDNEFGLTCNIHDPTNCAKERVHRNSKHYDSSYKIIPLGMAKLLDEDESNQLTQLAFKRLK